MAANLAHFALNADDVSVSRAFYETVFGWTFTPWGPPGFLEIRTGAADSPGIPGALHGRRDVVHGLRATGPECTFAVDDVDATATAVRDSGGKVVLEPFAIEGVGRLIFFQDPAGNVIGAMQYDAAERAGE
jgi:uncharacterized protein